MLPHRKILAIEDDRSKIEKIKEFFSTSTITVRESFRSGVLELKMNRHNYDLLILDMTIPIWDKGKNEISGNYEQFGGEKVLAEMKRKKIEIPTILFTMFDVFPSDDNSITFDELNHRYSNDFSDFYLGGVYYNSNDEKWKDAFNQILKNE